MIRIGWDERREAKAKYYSPRIGQRQCLHFAKLIKRLKLKALNARPSVVILFSSSHIHHVGFHPARQQNNVILNPHNKNANRQSR
jgi:hypothetical protein